MTERDQLEELRLKICKAELAINILEVLRKHLHRAQVYGLSVEDFKNNVIEILEKQLESHRKIEL